MPNYITVAALLQFCNLAVKEQQMSVHVWSFNVVNLLARCNVVTSKIQH